MKTTLTVEGMSCEHCVRHVREALKGVAGVGQVNVDLQKKSAEVEHGDSVSPDALRAAVEEAGYGAV